MAEEVEGESSQEEEEEEEEKWLKYYSSSHQILLVGDGDFSFSLCLANSFGSASNMVATSLDQYDVVIKKYSKSKSNIEGLEKLGATVLHGVDATKMKFHTDLRMRKFDRIIFNFPHAGFHGKEDNTKLIKMHRSLVQGFFKNSSGMLRADGEVHVNHKTTPPYNHWNLEELALAFSLGLIERVDFTKEDYPGYNNKRGDGARCDEPFPLGECSTFKFRFVHNLKKKNTGLVMGIGYPQRPLQVQEARPHVQQLSLFDTHYPHAKFVFNMHDKHMGNAHPFFTPNITNECSRYFGGYFRNVVDMFGRTGYDVRLDIQETLRFGFARYMNDTSGRDINGYTKHLQELHCQSISRSAWLRSMLANSGH